MAIGGLLTGNGANDPLSHELPSTIKIRNVFNVNSNQIPKCSTLIGAIEKREKEGKTSKFGFINSGIEKLFIMPTHKTAAMVGSGNIPEQ
jgi:hypothetical protein